MHISKLDYDLPKEAIAQFPSEKREASKLLFYKRDTQKIEHLYFEDLPNLLPEKYHFFRNKVAVLKARIFAKRVSGGEVECLLLNPAESPLIWTCMIRPAKKMPIGSYFFLEGFFKAKVLEKFSDGQAKVEFFLEKHKTVLELSEELGHVPLPPYIARDVKSPDYNRDFDNTRYETVYADKSCRNAVAAPTAGLHFSNELIQKLENNGNTFCDIVLNVGIGTFQPLKCENIPEHKMHAESYNIDSSIIKNLCDSNVKKLAVGTTSLRAMEDFMRKNPNVEEGANYSGDASLFIYPPQKIISADALITNFHLPRSTLMCLVGAFIAPESQNGIEILKEIYKEALSKNYRFFSYGDAMLIL